MQMPLRRSVGPAALTSGYDQHSHARFGTPMGLFDPATSFWLLFRGLRSPQPQ